MWPGLDFAANKWQPTRCSLPTTLRSTAVSKQSKSGRGNSQNSAPGRAPRSVECGSTLGSMALDAMHMLLAKFSATTMPGDDANTARVDRNCKRWLADAISRENWRVSARISEVPMAHSYLVTRRGASGERYEPIRGGYWELSEKPTAAQIERLYQHSQTMGPKSELEWLRELREWDNTSDSNGLFFCKDYWTQLWSCDEGCTYWQHKKPWQTDYDPLENKTEWRLVGAVDDVSEPFLAMSVDEVPAVSTTGPLDVRPRFRDFVEESHAATARKIVNAIRDDPSSVLADRFSNCPEWSTFVGQMRARRRYREILDRSQTQLSSWDKERVVTRLMSEWSEGELDESEVDTKISGL